MTGSGPESSRAASAAGLPLLALYSVATGIAEEGADWLLFLLAAGGYLLLPPSAKDAGRVRWERPPAGTPGGPALPEIGAVLDALVDTLN
ncbi:hypothetical protein ADL27_63280 [Streptomyces sp. NRRL F-6602]|nr:hypothetical protein ADL27_63280 [Streptomyces sp. NRRL F-6602]